VKAEQGDIVQLTKGIFEAAAKTNVWVFSEVDAEVIRVIDAFEPPADLESCETEDDVVAAMVARNVSLNTCYTCRAAVVGCKLMSCGGCKRIKYCSKGPLRSYCPTLRTCNPVLTLS